MISKCFKNTVGTFWHQSPKQIRVTRLPSSYGQASCYLSPPAASCFLPQTHTWILLNLLFSLSLSLTRSLVGPGLCCSSAYVWRYRNKAASQSFVIWGWSSDLMPAGTCRHPEFCSWCTQSAALQGGMQQSVGFEGGDNWIGISREAGEGLSLSSLLNWGCSSSLGHSHPLSMPVFS